MFQRKLRRFRHRSNGRGHQRSANGDGRTRIRSNSFLNNDRRNNFRSAQSAEKLFQKYSDLAKEALSSGDKTSSENFLQHADHFMRVIEDKKRNQNQTQNQVNDEKKETSQNLAQESQFNRSQAAKEEEK